jgi:hypothetical protein
MPTWLLASIDSRFNALGCSFSPFPLSHDSED